MLNVRWENLSQSPLPMKLPPIPKWNSATDDIDANDLFARSQEYEKSLLPPDLTFPRAGQIWETIRDCQVQFMTLFQPPSPRDFGWISGQSHNIVAPFGQARLTQGERVQIEFTNETKPLVIWFRPLRYDELQEGIVPAEIRSMPLYCQYRLSLPTAPTSPWLRPGSEFFLTAFRLIEDVA